MRYEVYTTIYSSSYEKVFFVTKNDWDYRES